MKTVVGVSFPQPLLVTVASRADVSVVPAPCESLVRRGRAPSRSDHFNLALFKQRENGMSRWRHSETHSMRSTQSRNICAIHAALTVLKLNLHRKAAENAKAAKTKATLRSLRGWQRIEIF